MKLTDIIYESVVDMYEARKPMTKDEFIKRAQEIHKDENGNPKYTYGNVDFINGQKNVSITCPIHGDFLQQPNQHLIGRGCRKCAFESMSSSGDDFIRKSKEIHKDKNGNPKYTYDDVNYVNSRTPVTITCPIHGDFSQIPKDHLNGRGCKECGKSTQGQKKSNTSEFVMKSQEIHKDENGNPKYTYDKVNYVHGKKIVTITCKVHGDFSQTPNSHLNGQGCPVCSESKGEKSVKKYLQEKKLNNVSQMKFDGCFRMSEKTKRCFKLPFDFYLPKSKIAIEIDGGYHFYPILANKEEFETRVLRDKLKNKFVENSGEINKLIRIYYNNNINEVISELEVLLKDKSSNKIVLSSNYPKLGWNK